jgi:hypothetical protein
MDLIGSTVAPVDAAVVLPGGALNDGGGVLELLVVTVVAGVGVPTLLLLAVVLVVFGLLDVDLTRNKTDLWTTP